MDLVSSGGGSVEGMAGKPAFTAEDYTGRTRRAGSSAPDFPLRGDQKTGDRVPDARSIPLRVLLAAQPELDTPVLQVVQVAQRVVMRRLLDAAGLKAD
jgi:hypothetical protein